MATYYVCPGNAFNGDGTTTAAAASGGAAGAYNTWVGVTLTANNTYKQKRGTTYTGVAVRPQSQVSAVATPLTIEAYYNSDGTDDTSQPLPLLVHTLNPANGSGCILVDTCTNVLVRNIAGTGSLGQASSAVTIRRSVGVTVSGVEGYGNSAGVGMYQDQASGTSTCTGIEVSDCYFHDNVVGGIWFEFGATSTAVFKRVKFLRNRIVNNGTGKYINVGGGGGSAPCGGIVSQDRHVTDGNINYRSMDFIIQDNVIQDSWGYGMNLQSIGSEQWKSTISGNEVSGSGLPGDIDTHGIWCGACYGIDIYENYVHDNYGRINGPNGSGCGIILDYQTGDFVGGDGNRIFRNIVENQWQGSTLVGVGASSGIYSIVNTNTVISANIVKNCRNGIGLYAGTSAGDILSATVINNTVLDCVDIGLPCTNGPSITAVWRNNLVVNGRYGIYWPTAGTGSITEDHNCFYGQTVYAAARGVTSPFAPTNGSPSGSDLLTDPIVGGNGAPLPTSPLIGAGTHTTYTRDATGIQRPNPPSIGAYDLPTQRRVLDSDPAAW
jgi:hypothetical protein